jgi:hypothetical protein
MNLDREGRLEIGALLGIAIGTALSILAAYGRWNDLRVPDVFLIDFQRWSWVRVSLLLTLITALAARAGVLRNEKFGILDSGLLYALVVVPLVLLGLYPGPEFLGKASDGSIFTLSFLLAVVHGFGFAFLRRVYRRRYARGSG